MSRLKSFRYIMFFVAVVLLLAFRTFYGMNNRFWDEDEKHIYLLGLELFSFQHWPYFGADIVHTATQIPGALQSFLVGIAFFVLNEPEAPFLLVNILSLFGILLFAFYITKHFPQYRTLTIVGWLTSLPWALEYSTNVYNPSYLLLPEIVFFVCLFETMPAITQNMIKPRTAHALMGLSLGLMVQLHLSWPLLIPFMFLSLWQMRKSAWQSIKAGLFMGIGFALPCLLLIPTLQHYGWHSILASGTENSQFKISHLMYFFNNIVRLLCYATYETFIFIGETMKQREEFLLHMFALVPMFFVLTLIAGFQMLYFFYAFLRLSWQKDRRARTSLNLFLFGLVTSSFVFTLSTRPPVSRNLYLLFPLSIWCMFLTVDYFVKNHKWGKAIFHVLIAVGISYHVLVAINRYNNFPQHSLYSNRALIEKSLFQKNPYIFEVPRYRSLMSSHATEEHTR